MTLYIFFCSDKCQLCLFEGTFARFYRLFQFIKSQTTTVEKIQSPIGWCPDKMMYLEYFSKCLMVSLRPKFAVFGLKLACCYSSPLHQSTKGPSSIIWRVKRLVCWGLKAFICLMFSCLHFISGGSYIYILISAFHSFYCDFRERLTPLSLTSFGLR